MPTRLTKLPRSILCRCVVTFKGLRLPSSRFSDDRRIPDHFLTGCFAVRMAGNGFLVDALGSSGAAEASAGWPNVLGPRLRPREIQVWKTPLLNCLLGSVLHDLGHHPSPCLARFGKVWVRCVELNRQGPLESLLTFFRGPTPRLSKPLGVSEGAWSRREPSRSHTEPSRLQRRR
jgi:hypothetical protein